MTDYEAYELLVKYTGSKELIMIKEMIHTAGIDTAVQNTVQAYLDKGKTPTDDFIAWIYQSYKYVQLTMQNDLN